MRVRLTALIPSRVMSLRRDGTVTYDLEDDDEFRFIAVDARERDLPGVQAAFATSTSSASSSARAFTAVPRIAQAR